MTVGATKGGQAWVTMKHGGETPTGVRKFDPGTDAKVGTKVVVRSFGRFRFGVIIKANKTRAVVRVPRNANGELTERAYPFSDILIPDFQDDRHFPAA